MVFTGDITVPKILLLGEAWGKQEEEERLPFVGASGRFLNSLLSQVGIKREECYATNVFNLRPRPTNDVKNLCGKRTEDVDLTLPPLGKGYYLRNEYVGELRRLYGEISVFQPDLIIAFGGAAVWAMTGFEGIKRVRGAPLLSSMGVPGIKILATYHPAAVLRDFSLRPIVLADLSKARSESEFPEVRRPAREFWLSPTIADLDLFEELHINPSTQLSIDIETKGNQITEVGFAPTESIALVVPFVVNDKPGNNYWPDTLTELRAWQRVRKWCKLPKAIIGQNHLYDANFLWRQYGIPMPHMAEDTMLLHHALQPEMEKGLGFLGSIYTNEPQWKWMRDKHSTAKRQDA